jgi:enoyl-CoA hydratase
VPYFALELARHRLTPPGFARVSAGAMFDPNEAMRFGYLDRVLEPDALDEAARAEATRLRALDMTSFTATKARINAAALQAIAAATESELGAG